MNDSKQASISFPRGFRAAGVSAGLKKSGKKDVAWWFPTGRPPWRRSLPKI